MKISPFNTLRLLVFLAAPFTMLLAPRVSRGCACGCYVFDVGTSSMLPTGPGGMFSLDYDYQNQNENRDGISRAPAANNPDKQIETHFVTADLEYFFNRKWGIEVEVPYDYRNFRTTGGATGTQIVSLHWGTFGDIRVRGIYTGFSEDMSSGVDFGFKLPTGSSTHNDNYGDIDRDSEIGTGSTDLLLGGFYRRALTRDNAWTAFGQLELDLPFIYRDQYRPGLEVDAAAGIYYNGWSIHGVKITPIAQVIASERTHDHGAEAATPLASGYQRILLSPGIEFDMHPMTVYADVELPVYRYCSGDQLSAPALFKFIAMYHF